MRLLLASDLKSRDGTVKKDAGSKNAIIEIDGESSAVRKRPGTVSLGPVGTGLAQLLACYNGELKSLVGNTLADLIVTTLLPTDPSFPAVADGGWSGLVYGNGKFVAVSGSTGVVVTSPDGITWTVSPAIDTSTYPGFDRFADGSLTFGNSIFVILAGPDDRAFTSTDGINWVDSGWDVSSGEDRLKFTNGKFFLKPSGNISSPNLSCYHSINGSVWSSFSIPHGYSGVGIMEVADVEYYLGRYYFLLSSSSAAVPSFRIAHSADLISWTVYASPLTFDYKYELVVSGGRLIHVGAGYSTDGSNWVAATGIPSGYIVDFGPGTVVLDSTIYTLAYEPGYANPQAAYKSIDSGATWSKHAQYNALTDFYTFMTTNGVAILSLSDSFDKVKLVAGSLAETGTTVVVDSSQTVSSLSPSLPFFAEVAGQAQSQNVMFLKNEKEAWTYDGTTLAKITDADYPGWGTVTPTSISRVGSLVTVGLSSPVNWKSGSYATVAGADQVEYNGTNRINVTDATHFTYNITIPATAVTSLTRTGTTVTATVPSTAGIINGDHVLVSGAVQPEYNIENPMTVVDETHFTYSLAFNPLSITTLVRTGATATATVSSTATLTNGDLVYVDGAAQAEYNGDKVVTIVDSNHFSFSVSGTPVTPATGVITGSKVPVTPATGTVVMQKPPVSPATGTLTATGGITTVPGVVYLDGYFFVMDKDAVIYGCELGAPTVWNALNFITANIEPGSGVALAKSQNYVIAFKTWSTEFFYDAGNAVGSPLSPVQSAFSLIGCASGDSVTNMDGTLFWASKTRQKGRSVHKMVGLQQQKISTPDIERILNHDSLANIYSYGVKVSGHVMYILGLKDSEITLVYDSASSSWTYWTSLVAGTPASCAITSSGTIATAHLVGHGMVSGTPVKIAGAAQSPYNGDFIVQRLDADNFSYEMASAPGIPATGAVTVAPYAETYFKYTKYVNCAGKDLVLHETSGELHEITEEKYDDNALPIDFMARTGKIDGGSNNRKTNSKLVAIGNKIDALAIVRWSDDDYATHSVGRAVNLLDEQPMLTRLGSFRRRSFEFQHIGNSPVQMSALELDIQQEK